MTNLRQAAQRALKAMEDGEDRADMIEFSDALIALRAALAEPEQEPYTWRKVTYDQLMEEVRNRGHEIRNAKITAPTPRKPLTDERIESVRYMRDVQGYDGNWNYDPYMQGLYNGLEFALSLLEVRQPEFKDAPATWLGDIKFKRDKLSSEAAHGIGEQHE